MQKKALILLSILFLTGCKLLEQHQEKRARKYIQKHAELIQTDTTRDTVFTIFPGGSIDTVYQVTPGKRDTIVINLKDRVYTRIIKSPGGDSLEINQQLKADTTASVNTTINERLYLAAARNGNFFRFVVISLLCIGLLLGLAKFIQAWKI